ncbi:unnamed protein product, partial [marine sediment metagenome]
MILMYHKVHPDAPTKWWVTPDQFYRQMLELKGYDVVYLDDYDPADAGKAVITFDGIYKNVLQFAAPILSRFNYPFELFITSDQLNGDNAFDSVEPEAHFVSIEECQELILFGGRLQWHTRSHANLKDVFALDEIQRELEIPEEIQAV